VAGYGNEGCVTMALSILRKAPGGLEGGPDLGALPASTGPLVRAAMRRTGDVFVEAHARFLLEKLAR
jgi:hypothetical protein